MEDNMSIGDVLALTRDNNTGFNFGGVGGLILILLFFFIFVGGGLWNNRGECNCGISSLERDVLNGKADTMQTIYTTSCETQKGVMQSNYDTLLNFKDMQAQMASCCCDIKSAIKEDGEATRALITQNRIADLEKELNQAQTAIANAVQTQNILNSVGRFVLNPATPNYYGYYGYGTTNV